jgi:hypothetical protein
MSKGATVALFSLLVPFDSTWFPGGFDLGRFADHVIDSVNRLFVRVSLAECLDLGQQLGFVERVHVDVVAVLFQQGDIGGADIALHPGEKDEIDAIGQPFGGIDVGGKPLTARGADPSADQRSGRCDASRYDCQTGGDTTYAL